ncbi:hypothetical protein T01_10200 [Trichinella spiralis]|uniref:PiggyBac transposable element-derived protein domain-containing protein n=1 Tax=Trichinella spiralis TaxID=6334 RepID=A0A0V1BDM1_TRISP|nr:hypothetical protein T01_10200 [Trichinella spiralis]
MFAVLRTTSGIQCPGDALKLLITPAMVNLIVQNTNKKAEKEWNENHPDALKSWKPTDEEEIDSSDESVPELWSVNNGRRIVRSVMTENRFKNLLTFCRFDEITSTKAAQVKRDKEATFRDMWTMFQTNLKNLYNLSAFLTDERAACVNARTKQISNRQIQIQCMRYKPANMG